MSHFLYPVPVPPFSSSLSGLPPAAGSPSSQPLCVGGSKTLCQFMESHLFSRPSRPSLCRQLPEAPSSLVPTLTSNLVPGPHTHIQPTDVSVWSANEHLEFMSQMGLLTSPRLRSAVFPISVMAKHPFRVLPLIAIFESRFSCTLYPIFSKSSWLYLQRRANHVSGHHPRPRYCSLWSGLTAPILVPFPPPRFKDGLYSKASILLCKN